MNQMIYALVLMMTLISSSYAKNYCAQITLDEKSVITIENDGSSPVLVTTAPLDSYSYSGFSKEASDYNTLAAMRKLISPKPQKDYVAIGLVSSDYEKICYLVYGGIYDGEKYLSYNYGLKKFGPEGAVFFHRDEEGGYIPKKRLIIK